jgi:site-specific recombinase XerD
MQKKEQFRNKILLKMKYHLGKNELAILEEALSESLYQVDIIDAITLPATVTDSNDYILNLFELKRSISLKESTMKAYLGTAKELIRYVNKPLVAMDKEDIEHYLRCKKKEGNKGSSLNNKRRKVLALFFWMKKQHFISENPVEEIERFKEVTRPVEYMKSEEVEQLKEGCKNRRDRALLEWLRSTASRKGEIPYVKINQIDWNNGELILYGKKTEIYRQVFLDGVALKYIKEYIVLDRKQSFDSNEPLFTHIVGDKSKVLGKGGIFKEIKDIAKRCGINKRVYPQLFRSTTATNIVRRGGTADDSGCYLGHKGSDVTRRHYIAEKNPKIVFFRFVYSM